MSFFERIKNKLKRTRSSSKSSISDTDTSSDSSSAPEREPDETEQKEESQEAPTSHTERHGRPAKKRRRLDRPRLSWVTDSPNGEMRVSFRSIHGHYLRANDETGVLDWKAEGIGPWEQFTVFSKGDGKVVLQSIHGKYVTCEGDDIDSRFIANRESPGKMETFKVREIGDFIALKTSFKKFISIQPRLEVEPHHSKIGDCAKIIARVVLWETRGGRIAIRNHHGRFLSANEDGSLDWTRDTVGTNEKWTIVPNGGRLSFRSAHGKFLCADGRDADSRLVADRESIGDWEKFAIEPRDQDFVMKTTWDKYVTVDPDGNIKVNADGGNEWETFVVV